MRAGVQGLLVAVALLMVASVAWEDALSPAAIVSSVKGRVIVARADRTFCPAVAGTRLYAGDQVRLGADAQATAIFPDRPRTVWQGGKGGAHVTVRAASPPRDNVWGRVWKYIVSKITPGRTTTETAATRGDGELAPLEPANSRVRARPVIFSWGALPDATYHLEVLSAKGEVLWKAENLKGNRSEYPSDSPALAPRTRYYWRVTAIRRGDLTASPLLWFELLSDEEREGAEATLARLQPGAAAMSLNEVHVYRSALLGSLGLHAEARQELALAAQDREDRSLDDLVKALSE